jgi:hypothetical protein
VVEEGLMRPVPRHIEDFVTRIGGRNRFGKPNYRVVWGPDRMEQCGGAWIEENGTVRTEMREVQKYGPDPVWHLEKWCAPEVYGDPGDWEYENALKLDSLLRTDEEGTDAVPVLDVQILGGFPYRGEYEHSFRLSNRLYFYTLEKLIRMNMAARFDETSTEQRQAWRKAEEDKKTADWKQMVIDLYKDRAPAYYEAVSFAGQKNHTKLLDRVDEIVKKMERGISGNDMKKALGLGFTKTG